MKTEVVNGVLVVNIEYDQIDASNIEEFKQEVVPVLEDARLVVFDLKELQFSDSSGLGGFLSCVRRVKANGGDIKLCNMCTTVRNLFELVRMHRVIDICNDVDEAVRALTSA